MRREDRKKQIRFRVILTVTAFAAAAVGVLCLVVYLRYGRPEKPASAEAAVTSAGPEAAGTDGGPDAGGKEGAGTGDASEIGGSEDTEEASEDSAGAQDADGADTRPEAETGSGADSVGTVRTYASVDDLPWYLILVNDESPLPEGFEVPELAWIDSEQAVDSRIYDELMQMLSDAHDAGTSAFVLSSFREHEKQEELFSARVQRFIDEDECSEEEADRRAAEWVARPGCSEHESGLAVDIVDADYAELEEDQADTPSQRWLMEHCYDYGFILRYPKNKTGITGIGHEPWHYRYVGKEAAAEFRGQNLCLEEYIGRLISVGAGD